MKPDPIAECAECGKPFMRRTTLQTYCRPRCLFKAQAAKEKAERAEFKRRKEAAKPRSALMAEAVAAFNRYIRLRDAGKPCICCRAEMDWNSTRPGGAIDAGHYMSVGSAPELRFDEQNVHAQRKNCNRPGGTTRASFRAGMVEREGLDVVERLEGPNPPRKYTSDDLRAIRDTYRAKAMGAEL
jgi:hypothetical protein